MEIAIVSTVLSILAILNGTQLFLHTQIRGDVTELKKELDVINNRIFNNVQKIEADFKESQKKHYEDYIDLLKKINETK